MDLLAEFACHGQVGQLGAVDHHQVDLAARALFQQVFIGQE